MRIYEVRRFYRDVVKTMSGEFAFRCFDGQPSWVVEAATMAEVEKAFPINDGVGGFLVTPIAPMPLDEAVRDWQAKLAKDYQLSRYQT